MASLLRRPAWSALRQCTSTISRRRESTFAHLDGELRARKIRPIFDDLTPLRSHRLKVTLDDFVNTESPVQPTASEKTSTSDADKTSDADEDVPPSLTLPPRLLPSGVDDDLLPPAHHLLYFEPALPPRDLLPDGTNPLHSPGAPFTRRMWAGGSVSYNSTSPLSLDGRRAVCVEGIRGVSVRGEPGREKVYVAIERRMATITEDEEVAYVEAELADDEDGAGAVEAFEQGVRERLWREDEADLGECSVLERRNIVFLREETEADKALKSQPGVSKATAKILKPHREATLFRKSITPDARLLFRFSALTFNAHAIHLDPQYCREQEGHRDLLVHGPLSLTLMLTFLSQKLGAGEVVAGVDYRNLAPLYCNEEATFCGAKIDGSEEEEDKGGRFEVWVEGSDGGVKVKGTVRTEFVEMEDMDSLMEEQLAALEEQEEGLEEGEGEELEEGGEEADFEYDDDAPPVEEPVEEDETPPKPRKFPNRFAERK